MSKLSTLWNMIHDFLYPALEEAHDDLSEHMRRFIAVCEMAKLDQQMKVYQSRRLGRKKKPRQNFAKAFVAKAVFNFSSTKQLLEYLRSCDTLRRLCGWEFKSDLPCEASFSNAFAEFAAQGLGEHVHASIVKEHCSEKLAGHLSRDSTAITAREKAIVKPKPKEQPKYKRGRPKKGEVREAKPQRRIAQQSDRTLAENTVDLPTACDWGRKKNSQGKVEDWKGYKAHMDVIDGDIPISFILTSASTHDSQVAIPLAQMSAERVQNLYDLMDAAYDVKEIHEYSKALGHRAIIDPNPRGGVKTFLDPADKRRFAERTSAERVNSMLKDNYGGRYIRVRGAHKVRLHLMFGIIAICALQILKLLT